MMTDMESATPALCRLQLGYELRKLRVAAGLTSREVVKKLLWSPSKLTRLETGENATVEPSDIMALCQIYAADAEMCELLDGYAVVTKTKREWWQSAVYRPVISPGFRAFLGMEGAASALHSYESEWVPGLLQTEEYVRVIHEAHSALSREEVNRKVVLRMKRQNVLHRDPPLKLAVVVSEAVLRRQIGGPDVMRAQLTHLIEAAAAPNVRVQVMPFNVGPHQGMNGAFSTFQFRDPVMLKPIVYLENLADHWITRNDADVELYEDAFRDLQALAPGPQESLSIMKQALKEH
ncbi:helix-turn-helix domain-containing protein [Streptomyces liangshanensis]|uniref:helix-turn-helix domain-containing protein n=1 Tax=Streptomyces liangshanensis TaxID=2717324 RepID=UPI0036DB6E26